MRGSQPLFVANEEAAEELRWRAAAIDRYLKRLRGSQLNFVDAFAAFRDWERQNPDEASKFLEELSEEAVAEFAKNPSTTKFVRDLAFAYFRPEQFPSRSALIEQLLFNPGGGAREREESDRVGKLLRGWSRDGEKGRLFDGGRFPSTQRRCALRLTSWWQTTGGKRSSRCLDPCRRLPSSKRPHERSKFREAAA